MASSLFGIHISCNKEYVPHFNKNQIPAKETQANDALIETFNSDLVNEKIIVPVDKFEGFRRLLRSL
jgi:hypothetical protein